MCVDVRKEPILQEVNNEDLLREANKCEEARPDISARNFWMTGQHAFFDVTVFNLFAQRHRKIAVEKCFRTNKNEKKRSYGNQVLQLKMGPSLPWSLLQMAVWEKNALGFTKD